MKSTYLSRPLLGALAAVVVVLAIGNFLSNRIAPAALYVPVNLTVAVVVGAIGLRHLTLSEIGLQNWSKGLRWGCTVVAVGLAMYLVALALPATRDLYYDARVYGNVRRLLYETVIRIPLGTVLVEELAFRGVLPALFARGRTHVRASIYASVLFGFWHVLPALNINEVNPVIEGLLGDGVAGRIGGVVMAVVGTTLLGLWMCFLRHRSGSLLTTIIAHIASNSGAYLFAWLYGASWLTGNLAGQ